MFTININQQILIQLIKAIAHINNIIHSNAPSINQTKFLKLAKTRLVSSFKNTYRYPLRLFNLYLL